MVSVVGSMAAIVSGAGSFMASAIGGVSGTGIAVISVTTVDSVVVGADDVGSSNGSATTGMVSGAGSTAAIVSGAGSFTASAIGGDSGTDIGRISVIIGVSEIVGADGVCSNTGSGISEGGVYTVSRGSDAGSTTDIGPVNGCIESVTNGVTSGVPMFGGLRIIGLLAIGSVRGILTIPSDTTGWGKNDSGGSDAMGWGKNSGGGFDSGAGRWGQGGIGGWCSDGPQCVP